MPSRLARSSAALAGRRRAGLAPTWEPAGRPLPGPHLQVRFGPPSKDSGARPGRSSRSAPPHLRMRCQQPSTPADGHPIAN
eukprot:6424962-Alexandrium_andersonii.AAC.1